MRDALHNKDFDSFTLHLKSFIADIPARLHIPAEAYYHSLVYMLLRLIGAQILLEKETDKGRIDAILDLTDKTYIIEFILKRKRFEYFDFAQYRHKGKTFKPLVKDGLRGQSPLKPLTAEYEFAKKGGKIKRVKTLALQALRQIEEKKYYEPYLHKSKKIIFLGIGFLEKEIHVSAKEWS